MGSLGMLFYVVECFSVNLENLSADAVGRAQLGGIDQQIQGDRRFVAVPLGEAPHQVHEIGALHTQRTQVGDSLAQLGTLVPNGLLEAGKAVRNKSEEHTSELQSRVDLVCRLLLEKKNSKQNQLTTARTRADPGAPSREASSTSQQ